MMPEWYFDFSLVLMIIAGMAVIVSVFVVLLEVGLDGIKDFEPYEWLLSATILLSPLLVWAWPLVVLAIPFAGLYALYKAYQTWSSDRRG